MEKIRTRFGDGSPVELSADEVRRDLEDGTREAAERGNIPALTKEELQHLLIFSARPIASSGWSRARRSFFPTMARPLK